MQQMKKETTFNSLFGFFWVLVMSFIISPAAAQGLMAETDMIKGARTGSLGVMERGYIEGDNPNARGRDGNPPIIIAAENGYVDVVRYLIYRKARIDDRGAQERTALTVAAARGDVEIMKLLLDAGADIDKTGMRKEVPIIIAAREGHVGAVKLLIEKGAYLEDTDLTGRTALDWARQRRNPELLQVLEEAQ
ncbi:MAG: ankyrin repeat domain-containing protein [Parvibaculales bacterium]